MAAAPKFRAPAGPGRRWPVNAFLAVFLPVIAIDAFHSVGDAHQAAKDALNPALVVTGLWQGPWRLYAPDAPKANLRLRAEIVFADQAVATWDSPDWTRWSALGKFVGVRHINYFNALFLERNGPARVALCAYLARTTPHPAGAPAAVVGVRLLIRGAIIPPVSERVVPAGPYLVYDDWEEFLAWRPGV